MVTKMYHKKFNTVKMM